MSTSVENWSGKPITKDTAIVDILARYCYLNNVKIKVSGIFRMPGNQRLYAWNVHAFGNCTMMTTSETRRRCLDGTLIECLK